jgi:hypothetical protein
MASTQLARAESDGASSEGSSVYSDSDEDDGLGGLFAAEKKKPSTELAVAEVITAVEDRVDAALLAEVKRYEALPSDAASYGITHFWDGRYMELGDLVSVAILESELLL